MNAAQAAEKAGVSPSTVTRWIQAGRLAAKRLPNGQLEIPADGLEAVIADRTAAPRSAASLALAVAEERIRGLEDLVAQQREWLGLSEGRLQLALQALPPPAPPRPWWQYWR